VRLPKDTGDVIDSLILKTNPASEGAFANTVQRRSLWRNSLTITIMQGSASWTNVLNIALRVQKPYRSKKPNRRSEDLSTIAARTLFHDHRQKLERWFFGRS